MKSSIEKYSGALYRATLRIEEATQEAAYWLNRMLNDEECVFLKEEIQYVLTDGHIDAGVQTLTGFVEILDEAKNTKRDYRYEIWDKQYDFTEEGFVCLDAAIDYALKNDGYVIEKVWYQLDKNGDIDYDKGIITSNVVWERENQKLL